jgi:uncharacterized protein
MPTRIIQVKVTARSKVSSLTQAADGTWVARLKSPPVDGKANRELIELIADRFACSKSVVSIKSGAGGRLKLVQISQ